VPWDLQSLLGPNYLLGPLAGGGLQASPLGSPNQDWMSPDWMKPLYTGIPGQSVGGAGNAQGNGVQGGGGQGMQPALDLAKSRIGVREIGDTNRGDEVDGYMKSIGAFNYWKQPYSVNHLEGQPWCVAFVYDTLLHSNTLNLNGVPVLSTSPVVQDQANYAARQHRLVGPGDALTQMKPGWIMVKWGDPYTDKNGWHPGHYEHMGLVTSVEPNGTFHTIEGNTNTDGGKEGYEVAPQTRNLNEQTRKGHAKYGFIRTTP
jgi:hypothetical protein